MIRLQQVVGSDGLRRFLPENGDWEELIKNCFYIGLGILEEMGAFPSNQGTNIRLQYCALQWTKYRQEYLNRRFQYGRDVHLRVNSRVDSNERDVISQLCDLHSGLNNIASVRSFAEQGETNPARQFHDGLYRIALASEVPEWSQDEIRSILQNAFFAQRRPLPELSQEELEEVNARLYTFIDRRLETPNQEFNGWLTANRTSLPTQISRRRGTISLTQQQAKAGLFSLGWLGMENVSQCINATMKTIETAIGDFNTCEERIYSSLYLRQPALNNFVPLQLLARKDFLAPAIVDIWNGQDIDEVMPSVCTLLYMYGRMARLRRAADRVGNQRRNARNSDEAASSETHLNEEITPTPLPAVNDQIRLSIIDSLQLSCNACQQDDLLLDYSVGEASVEITCHCNNCDDLTIRVFEIDELRELLDPEDGSVT